ncbi:uncharacterized protein LOC130640382 [Hydractinia symbiolongicarpus]|uniref:uncharacterized protein LOC130640382 n=1 Tax=Hydractinia symbiolongicarpus TaxID=13093 RepID=UPI00254E2E3D|nr:uncharacterized protein LOC130640382 [Hydractinia symbiolongicarpus]
MGNQYSTELRSIGTRKLSTKKREIQESKYARNNGNKIIGPVPIKRNLLTKSRSCEERKIESINIRTTLSLNNIESHQTATAKVTDMDSLQNKSSTAQHETISINRNDVSLESNGEKDIKSETNETSTSKPVLGTVECYEKNIEEHEKNAGYNESGTCLNESMDNVLNEYEDSSEVSNEDDNKVYLRVPNLTPRRNTCSSETKKSSMKSSQIGLKEHVQKQKKVSLNDNVFIYESDSDSCGPSDVHTRPGRSKSEACVESKDVANAKHTRRRTKSDIDSKQYFDQKTIPLPSHLIKRINYAKRHRRLTQSKSFTANALTKPTTEAKKLHLRMPLRCRINVKLIPDFDQYETARSIEIKHVLCLRITPLSFKEIEKAHQLFEAEITFTEGTMRDVVDTVTGKTQKRLVRAHSWTGFSHTVELSKDKLTIQGNFQATNRGLIPFLEFELELQPNYKSIPSADTGEKLLSVGRFVFQDTRQIIKEKIYKWKAAVERFDGFPSSDSEDEQ